MSAKQYLKGELRSYGYEKTPGISVVAKQGPGINLYDALRQADNDGLPTVFWRGINSEWLVTMKMSDFMELYRTGEMERRDG